MNESLFSLAGRVALVTGGNGGLGRAVALGFCDMGAQVAVTGRDPLKNQRAAEALGERGAVFTMHVGREDEVERTIAAVVERFGRLDILVNNAGTVYVDSILEVSRADWDEVIETNLTGAFLCARL